MSESKLRTQSMDFAVSIINLVKYLKEKRESIISNQIGRSGTSIGANIREARLAQHIGQTQLVRLLQLQGVSITRESLVKIERGIQHIKISQLKGIKEILNVSYEDLFK